jgi:DNA-binding CsgD family transcriptional regulator
MKRSPQLSPQQKRVEALVLQGLCPKEIANKLGNSVSGTRSQILYVCHKRGASSMHQLTAMMLGRRIRELEARLGTSIAADVGAIWAVS